MRLSEEGRVVGWLVGWLIVWGHGGGVKREETFELRGHLIDNLGGTFCCHL